MLTALLNFQMISLFFFGYNKTTLLCEISNSHSHSVLLEPKQKGDIIWKFDNAVNIEIACNVPGHYQVGMIAKINIK